MRRTTFKVAILDKISFHSPAYVWAAVKKIADTLVPGPLVERVCPRPPFLGLLLLRFTAQGRQGCWPGVGFRGAWYVTASHTE